MFKVTAPISKIYKKEDYLWSVLWRKGNRRYAMYMVFIGGFTQSKSARMLSEFCRSWPWAEKSDLQIEAPSPAFPFGIIISPKCLSQHFWIHPPPHQLLALDPSFSHFSFRVQLCNMAFARQCYIISQYLGRHLVQCIV